MAHLVIHASHSQLGNMTISALKGDPERKDEEEDDEDGISVTSIQLPISAQACPSHPHDRRPPRPGASGSGRNLDQAMMKLVEKITENTQPQDRLQFAVHVQESAKPCFAFCHCIGAELSFFDANLWSCFQKEAFDL